MKIITNSLMLLVIGFTLNYKTCDGILLDVIEILGNAIDLHEKLEKVLGLVIEKEDKAAIDAKKKDEKLQEISSKIDQLEQNLQKSFKEVLTKMDNIANNTVSSLIAINLETTTFKMREELDNIVRYARDAKNGSLADSNYFIGKLNSLSNNVQNYKTELKVIFQRKVHSLDYLEYVKTKSYNVCNHRMSQLQMLDIFRALYVEHIIRFALSELLIIAIHDKLGSPDKDNHGKRILYEQVQDDFNTELLSFKNIMSDASREFQTCNKPSTSYKTGSTYGLNFCYLIDPNDVQQPATGTITNFKQTTISLGQEPICWYYFSLRPVNAEPGYVVIGAKIEKHVNILYIRVLQAKLLPNGLVDSKTVSYNNNTAHGIDEPVAKIHWSLDDPHHAWTDNATVIDLTKTVASDDRVVTGLSFAVSKKGHVYLEVNSTAINLRKGLLYANTTRPEKHEDALKQEYQVTKVRNMNKEVNRTSTGLQPVEPNQLLLLVPSYGKGAHPYIDGDIIFPMPLTLLSGVSLYVKEVQGEQGFLSFRMHTFNVVPHIGVNVSSNGTFPDILEVL